MSNIKEKIVIKKKFNIKNILLEYLKYYKENLRLKHIICFVIMIIIFAASLNMFYTTSFDPEVKQVVTENYTLKSFGSAFGEKVFLSFMIIFAGFTPYIYISVIGLLYGYHLANTIVASLILTGSGNLVLLIIGGAIQIIGISLSVATGISYCKISSKRHRYSSTSSYGFNDFKKAYYSLRKNQEGIKKVEESNKKKYDKRQKLNVKVPYIMFAISFAISIILILIGIIIK